MKKKIFNNFDWKRKNMSKTNSHKPHRGHILETFLKWYKFQLSLILWDGLGMTDTLRGNNLLQQNRTSNPIMRRKTDYNEQKLAPGNYCQNWLIDSLHLLPDLSLSYRFESIVRFNPLGMSITLDEALVSIIVLVYRSCE